MKLFRQSESMCGPTSLRILLSHYADKDYSEKYLKKLSGATKRDGVNHQGMRLALARLGYPFREITGKRVWRALSNGGAPAICGVWSPGDSRHDSCGHYVVVSKVKDGQVEVYDPEYNDIRMLTKKEFDCIWFDEESNTKWRQWMLSIDGGARHGQ